MTDKQQARSRISIWMQAVRAFSFTASLTPVLVGAGLALYHKQTINWLLFPLAALAALLIHAGTNLISDYFDFQKGVDKDYTFGSSRVLAEKLLEPKELLRGALIAFGLTCILGLILVLVRGIPLLIIGLVGLLGGYLYTGRPLGYKYIALGDVCVFFLMGPLMVIGAYLVLTGTYSATVFYVSLPIGFLVTAILHANNTRDITHDKSFGVKTLANLLGLAKAKGEYLFLIAGAYLGVLVMIALRIIPLWSLVVLLSLPLAIKNIKTILKSREDNPEALATLDAETAKFHFLFGMLLLASLLLGAFL